MLPVRLVLVDDIYRLEVICSCGELAKADVLMPYANCERCGADLDPDPADVMTLGRA